MRLRCGCMSRLKIVGARNVDMSEWKTTRKKGKPRYTKIKHPTMYQKILQCRNNECRKIYVFKGKSKGDVNRLINAT